MLERCLFSDAQKAAIQTHAKRSLQVKDLSRAVWDIYDWTAESTGARVYYGEEEEVEGLFGGRCVPRSDSSGDRVACLYEVTAEEVYF